MKKDTQNKIEEYKARIPGLKERIVAVALMLAMSIVMISSASYAWLTISRAPEMKGMSTAIAGNGNLEIALVSPEGGEPGNANGQENTLLNSNITWGNLVNLSDSGYGVDQIALRPALLSGYNRDVTPLYGASYDASGRVTSTSQTYSYATWREAEDGSWFFDAAEPTYGVRAIASVTYENISGNAAANRLLQRAKDSYASARGLYLNIIDNEYLISSPGVNPVVMSMDALSKILQVFVQEKADYYVARLNGTAADQIPPADYSHVVVYTHRLAVAFQEVLEKEGEGLVYLANLQAYKAGAETTETFADINALLTASAATLTNHGVQLESLASFKADYNNIKTAVNGLAKVIADYELDEFSTGKGVLWKNISTYINYLVNINTTTIAQNRNSEPIAIGSINSDTLMSLLGVLQNCQKPNAPADVVIYDGVLSNLEKRLPESASYTLEGNDTIVSIPLTVKVNVILININMKDTPVYAAVRTKAAEPFISNNDFAYTESLDSTGGNKGDAVANDTYGMAIDLWVRTNAPDVVMTLEGGLVTELQPVYGVNKNGDQVRLFTVIGNGESIEAYYMEDGQGAGAWYEADSHTQFGTAGEIASLDEAGEPVDVQDGYTVTAITEEVVVGYDGVNRVWEDYLSLIEAGLMAENSTTQGGGSCYVFYADPSDQTRILHLLEAFTVVFVDQEGNTLGTAKLDTAHYYSINGKTTVPLEMTTGQTYYTDEEGNQHLGVTALRQNEATWITALIYLDGQRLSNADVLAVGEIQGSLNIQFGSSVSLTNMDDDKLRNEYREITASAAAGGANSTNSQQPITFTYDGTAREVTVTLLVEGEQPRSISGFFVRSISQSQGTRGETVAFTPNGNNTWSATFRLTRPGRYSLRNLIVDGGDYTLDDGTVSGLDNFPTIEISGLGVSSVYCDLAEGITMTADNAVSATVSASINASEELMPSQVRALFRTVEGKEFAALMSYNRTQGNWVGTASITESGTYTLQYLVIDGEYTELDPEMQSTHIIYLGLTTQVWFDGVLVDNEVVPSPLEFEYQGPVDLVMRAKLFDGSGNELKKMEDVWLYYWAEGSTLDQDGMNGSITWNDETGYYEGVLELRSGGTFLFSRVVTNKSSGNPNTVRKAAVSPVFTAYVTDPPVYQGHGTTEYQFVPNGGATMNVTMTNAQTSTMWAEIENLTTGDIQLVPCTNRIVLDQDTNLYRFEFAVPAKEGKQDGNWQLLAIYMQGVAKPNADPNEDPEWVPVSEGEPTAENSYVVDMSGNDITAYVVQTVYVNGVDSQNVKFDDVVFGKDTDGKVTGAFMQEHTLQNITLTIKDWKGEPIQGVTSVTWQSTYNNDSLSYGGYTTGAYQNPPALTLSGSGTTYTLAAQTFHVAGSYTSRFTISLGENTESVTGPSFQIWSVKPTAKITTGTTSGTFATKITWKTNFWGTPTFTASEDKTSSYTDYAATLYAKATVDAGGLTNAHGFLEEPTLVIVVSGVANGYSVKLTLPAGSAGAIDFTRTGNGTISKKIGITSTWKTFGIGGRHYAEAYSGHGSQTITTMEITKDNIVYTVTLDNPLVITNPSSVNQS